MNIFLLSAHYFRVGILAVVTGIAGIFPSQSEPILPAVPLAAQVAPERLFDSPAAAIKALGVATESGDLTALRDIFGREIFELMTGDGVQDANNAKRFATALAQGCTPVPEGADKITLEVGTNQWPMPIPLVRTDGQWHFDTAAGKEEVINRHIGKDELNTIGVCRAFVAAQRQFAGMNPAGAFAEKFKSSEGRQDGLYWPAAENEAASPFGPLVTKAYAQGYAWRKDAAPQPFHGYYFRILNRQGPAANGGAMSYRKHGRMTGGFALVAYPQTWDKSGIMTFLVGQDGKVYQQNLGETTGQTAGAMKEYNPDSGWTLVQDEGVRDAALEK